MTQLKRALGLTSAVSIVVGGVIGSGIFLKPLNIARNVPDPAFIHASWIGLGIICLFGAFAYAELGVLFPEAGGQYAFLREGWGRFIAFLYGWCLFLIINTGTIAALAVAFAQSLGKLVTMSTEAEVGVAIAMILLLATINHFGVVLGAVVQNVLTFLKLAALAAIALGGFLLAQGSAPAGADPGHGPVTLGGLVTAAVAIFWAYEGWYQLPFNAAELKQPERTLPRGLILGTVILIVAYVTVNIAYLRVIPIDEMRALTRDAEVPELTLQRSFGGPASQMLAALICLSTFGASNPNLLSTPRAFYAMAEDGLGFRALTRVHPRYRTPTVAIWTQALWSIVLVLVLKGFHDLTDYVIFAALIFYALTVASVYVLRRREPDRPRAYRCTGYPVTPALFIAVALFVDLHMLTDAENRRNALIGLGILAAGAVVYAARMRKTAAAAVTETVTEAEARGRDSRP
jgi:APA family basic amino acid/polyamine antiporter